MASNPCNPAISPHTGTSGHPSHCDDSGKREKKRGGVVGGKQKNRRSTNAEKQVLKEKAKAVQGSSQRGSKYSPYTETA